MRTRRQSWLAGLLLLLFLAPLTSWSQANQGLVPDSTELRVLHDFYVSTKGDTWPSRANNWPATPAAWQAATLADAATWFGLAVTEGDISRLSVDVIQGTLPASLGLLKGLTFFNVPNSPGLTGPLPASLGNLTNLTWLRTTNTNLSGPLPASLGNLTNLQYLYLERCQFSGPLPASLGNLHSLLLLTVLNNHFTGPIPPELGQLTQLQSLTLSNFYDIYPGQGNAFTGGIPREFGNLTNLTFLDLSLNPVGGAIPVELGQLTNLTFLELDDCGMAGAVPAELLRLPQLNTLILGTYNLHYHDNNRFTSLPSPSVVPPTAGLYLGLEYNQFGFGTLEPYFSGPGQLRPGFSSNYGLQTLPQDKRTIQAEVGQAVRLPSGIGGTRTHYQWQRRQAGQWQDVAGATDSILVVQAVSAADSGSYRTRTTNEWVTNLTLYSAPRILQVTADEGHVPNAVELRALRALYTQTRGAEWFRHDNWPATDSAWAAATIEQAATWYGVGVSERDVVSLELGYLNLQGTLPTAFGDLRWLQVAYLNGNQLSGFIPTSLGQLKRLQVLYLTRNQLTGPIPAGLGETALTQLGLDHNQLSGPIPAALRQLQNLQLLYLHENQLSGLFPEALLACRSLQAFYIGGNQLTGPVPTALTQLTQLRELGLDNNLFTGPLPADLPKLPLQALYLSTNRFTSLPSWLGQASVPGDFYVNDNELDFAALEGNFIGPNQPVQPNFYYDPQYSPLGTDTTRTGMGGAARLNGQIGGTYNHYQWQRQQGGQWIDLPAETQPTLSFTQATVGMAGTYRTRVSNDWVPATTLYSANHYLKVSGNLPPNNPSENRERNWTLERSFDGEGNEVAASKQFVDGLGRPTQAQARNAATQQVFATQTVYNTGGQPVLQTLAAPTNNQSFNYKEKFVTASGTDFGPAHFEGSKASAPAAVDAVDKGTLGYYFSELNAQEPLTPITSYPYSLVEPYEGPLGGTRRAAGPGDELRMGKGREAKGRDFPLRKEFDSYITLRPQFVPGSPLPTLQYQGMKSVSLNADGRESIVVTNKEGQAIISCLSGAQYPGLPVFGFISAEATNKYDDDAPAYQDIHIPAAGPQNVKFTMGKEYATGGRVLIVNLLTQDTTSYAIKPASAGVEPEQNVTMAPGFYRFVSVTGTQWSYYEAHYGNFSYTYYDDAGRVVATLAPKDLNVTPNGLGTSVSAPVYTTRNTYDTSSRLLATESNDEGRSEYVYAQDGRIRFSQSALQRKTGRFSYSNYDEVGRVVESGEYTPGNLTFESHLTATPAATSVLQTSLLEDRTRSGGLTPTNCAQRNQVWYDLPWDGTTLKPDGTVDPDHQDSQLNGRTQEFVLGAVAKTQNENVKTWYSYDELGRVTWVVQDIKGVGMKTLDYKYDFSGNVLEVAYQKGQPDSFYHAYGYDAAQRLTTVYTSPDGTKQTLQAEYSYYLHGPLKRVQVAGDLQGVDYTYTLQGALKAINHVNQTLEPGHDSPERNGVQKDLFALTLDYFSGDYRSRAIDAPLPITGAATVPTRYDGTIQSATWRTAATGDIHRVAYTYDEKSQLEGSQYGQWQKKAATYQPGPAPANALQEGNFSYDANGNMLSLRRTDQSGNPTDDFRYSYKANTNQLQAVHSTSAPVSDPGVLDYDYDELGQMIRQRDGQEQRYFAYDVTGKTTGVYLNADHTQPLVEYAYDDRGFRVRQTVYPATAGPAHVTTYVRDVAGNLLALYEQETSTSPAVRSEVPLYGAGRLGTFAHLNNGTDDYRYELTDHLGAARVVFHRPTTEINVETMELDVPTKATFQNADLYRRAVTGAAGGQFVARLTNSQIKDLNNPTPDDRPLKRVLAVTRGDTITFSALAQWNQSAATSGATPYVLVGAAAGVNALSQRGPEGQRVYGTNNSNWLSLLAAGLGFTLGQQAPTSMGGTGLEGWIRYRVLDAQGKPMLDAQGRELKGVDYMLGTGKWEYLQTGVRVPQDGTIEVIAGTSGVGEAVYFDNLRVEQTGGLIVQEQHQYAYGAPLPGLSYTVGNRRYRYGYQGQYAEHDSLTGFESFELRLYNSRIGRWMSYDPKGQFHSPYVGMGNNPIAGVDSDGGWTFRELWNTIKQSFRGSSGGGWAGSTSETLPDVVVTGKGIHPVKSSAEVLSSSNIPDPETRGVLHIGSRIFNYAANYGTAGMNLFQFATGTGPDYKIYANNRVSIAMKNSYGVNKARDQFYKFVNEGRDVYNNPYTGAKGSFGFADLGPVRAGTDAIEQYVGTYRIQAIQVVNKDLVYTLTNETSANSLLYDLGPSWERVETSDPSGITPLGTTRQAYIFTEPIDFSRVQNTTFLKP